MFVHSFISLNHFVVEIVTVRHEMNIKRALRNPEYCMEKQSENQRLEIKVQALKIFFELQELTIL